MVPYIHEAKTPKKPWNIFFQDLSVGILNGLILNLYFKGWVLKLKRKAIIKYDPVLDKFRGEFIGLNGGADFYATTIEELKKEGSISLKVFLEMCKEEGLNPNKEYSGTFNLRVPPELHAQIAERAAAEGKSLNKCVTDLLGDAVHSS